MVQTVRHRTWIWLGKVFLAGVIAFIALTLFCMVYYKNILPVPCSTGATDYKYAPNDWHSRATEGFCIAKSNNDGYLNLFDYDENVPIDILLLGSSHAEAMQMPMQYSMSSVLNGMAENITYGIAVSGHTFLTCASNLSAAIQTYSPTKYAIVESASIQFSDQQITQVLKHSFPEIDKRYGFLREFLRHVPCLQLLFNQTRSILGMGHEDNEEIAASASKDNPVDPALLSALLSQMADTAASSGARLIIAYHPGTTLNKDGSITFSTTEAEEDAFAGLCAENGVYFLDMRDRFQAEYDESHILPYGFANTSVGSGHLNRYGHEMMARELYALMQEVGL